MIQLSTEALATVLPLLGNHLLADSPVVHSYAAMAISKILIQKMENHEPTLVSEYLNIVKRSLP